MATYYLPLFFYYSSTHTRMHKHIANCYLRVCGNLKLTI